MMQIQVTEIDQENIGIACDLLGRFFAEEGFDTSSDLIARNTALLASDSGHWVALATIGGQAVGIVTATTALYVEWGRLGEIGDLYVVPDQRGKGVARTLIEASTRWCKESGCSAVSVVVTDEGQLRHDLKAFYQRHGFGTTGREILTKTLS